MSTRPVIMGELGLLSLFDLAQLLMLNGATGTLHVASSEKKGMLRFEKGQIANAVDERLHEGEEAAFRIFGWRAGTFEFRVEPPTGGRTIFDSTEGLMLEAARRMDEAGVSEDGSTVTQALQARAGKFEALREAFQRVAFDASPAGRVTHSSDGTRFGALAAPGDALLYRPEQPVRLLRDGRWHEGGEGVLEPAAFQQLVGDFFDSLAANGEHVSHALVSEDGRQLQVTRVSLPHEALLVRALATGLTALPRLSGEAATLDHVLALPAGLVLVGAPGIRAAEQLLKSALASMLERRPVTAVLTAERGRWLQGESQGALLLSPRAGLPGALEAFAPDLVAFDVAHADLSLEALHQAPLVLCAVVAPDAASLMPRWLARHGLTSADAGAVPLAGAEVGVLFTADAHGDGHTLVVQAAHAVSGSLNAPRASKPGPRAVPAADATGDAALRGVIEQLQRELRDAA